jgi:hypothetical protein
VNKSMSTCGVGALRCRCRRCGLAAPPNPPSPNSHCRHSCVVDAVAPPRMLSTHVDGDNPARRCKRYRVTRHTSHVTRHTSHVTRHTSHVTRHAVGEANEIVLAHGRQLSVVTAACVSACNQSATLFSKLTPDQRRQGARAAAWR